MSEGVGGDSALSTQHSALLAAFLLGLSGIVFQLALTRLSSAALDYHLTFLAISAAMLGLSAGGTWVAGWLPAGGAGDDRVRVRRLCLAGAAAQALVLAA